MGKTIRRQSQEDFNGSKRLRSLKKQSDKKLRRKEKAELRKYINFSTQSY